MNRRTISRLIFAGCLFLSLKQHSFGQETYSPKYAALAWENDVFNGTDQYFTNGSNLLVFHPIFRKNPFDKLVPSLPHSVDDLHGIHIRQDIYTPADVDTLDYLPTDRPYAGCLMFYMQKVSFLPGRKLRLNGNVGLGFIGDISLGGKLQDGVHNLIKSSIYSGWYNQLGNRLLINYTMNLEKGMYTEEYIHFITNAFAEIGNLRTNVGAGYLLRIGDLAPYFSSYCYDRGGEKVYFSFFLDTKFKFVIYDATLDGAYQDAGQPIYDLKRFVFKTFIGGNIMFRRYNFTITQNFLTAEFSTGSLHKYVNMELGYRF